MKRFEKEVLLLAGEISKIKNDNINSCDCTLTYTDNDKNSLRDILLLHVNVNGIIINQSIKHPNRRRT